MFGYKFISETEHEELLEEVAMLRDKLSKRTTDESGVSIDESLFVDIQQLHPVAIERRQGRQGAISVIHANGTAATLYLQCSRDQHERLVTDAAKYLTAPITNAEYDAAAQVCAEAYQVLGAVAERAGLFDNETVIKTLDNLITMSLEHTDVLPFDLPPKKRARKASASQPTPITGDQPE